MWSWIVEDRRAKQIYGIMVQKVHYVVSKCHYIVASAEGANSTLKDKKTKVANTICLYFVYKATFTVDGDNPIIDMDKVFQVPKGLGNLKSLYDEPKYTNYTGDKLRTNIYLQVLRSLTRMGDKIFNIFGGTNLCTSC